MKSFARLFAASATLLFLAFPAQAQSPAHEGHLPLTGGVVKKVDAAAGKITIAHERIANLDMPAMTMAFKARDPAVLGKWKAGDRIRFRATEEGGAMIVVSIEAAK